MIPTDLAETIRQMDASIRRDPAQRGLISSEPVYGPLCPNHLASASAHLAQFGTHIAIVTGFFIPRGTPPAAESDGPLGAVVLAGSLLQAGIETTLITDGHCINALRVAAEAAGLPAGRVLESPHDGAAWRGDFFRNGPGKDLTHLIAIERVGPSHTPESLARQPRSGPVPQQKFTEKVAPENWNHCHNMRGEVIDQYTGDLHRLFEELPLHRPLAKTIGIGDGANEIGMGAVPWEELERRLSGEQSGRVPCRIAADWNIIAGTSNWGGYALAAATLLLRNQSHILETWDREQQARVLEQMVTHGPAVDGVTRLREQTVDGIPFLTYIQPWENIRELLGLKQ